MTSPAATPAVTAWKPYEPWEAAGMLETLRDHLGFAVRCQDGRLVVSPGARLTDHDRRCIALAKPRLLEVLAEEARVSAAALVDGFS